MALPWPFRRRKSRVIRVHLSNDAERFCREMRRAGA